MKTIRASGEKGKRKTVRGEEEWSQKHGTEVKSPNTRNTHHTSPKTSAMYSHSSTHLYDHRIEKKTKNINTKR